MTMSVTPAVVQQQPGAFLYSKVSFAFVTASDGTAGGATTQSLTGELIRAVFVPGSGGSQPTNAFDVVVNDSDGYDVLAGQGANISNAAPTTVVSSLGAVFNSALTLAVTNAGDTKSGTIILYIKA